MSSNQINISKEELESEESRFQRFSLIGWWNQERLAGSKVLVVGAGALGNELIKNLALLGVGNVLVVDLDFIENSNLSRSVLFRTADNGKPKAEVAAAAARSIYPAIKAQAIHGDVVNGLGLGVFRWADIVLGGLDNREARLAINRNCWKLNKPWIDGAIEQIQGVVRFFEPDGPCYECTMSETDWRVLQNRRSCNLLTKDEMETGKTPTTPTISSIVAGVQSQEAVKYLHGLPTMRGKGWIFEGLSGDSYGIEYQRKEDCYSHEILDEIFSLELGVADVTARELLQKSREMIGGNVVLEFAREMIEKFVCPNCKQETAVFCSVSKTKISQTLCPHCKNTRREVVTFYRVTGEEPFVDLPLEKIGVPHFDIIFASNEERMIGLELAADSKTVLGCLVGSEQKSNGVEI